MTDDAGALVARAAGFWRRFGAALIDGVLISVVNLILRAAVGTIGQLLGIVVSLAYFTYFHGRTGQTPGDAALGIRVVDVREHPGRPIGYPRAFARWLVSIASTVVILLGYLLMLWDPDKQTWHDKAVGSLPVFDQAASAAQSP
ncbi:MAG: RDD family protein, partial [Jatrophihabitantaceae bacterium]